MIHHINNFYFNILRVEDDETNGEMFAFIDIAGDIVNKELTVELINGLIRFCKKYGKDIERINEENHERERLEQEEEYRKMKSMPKKPKSKGKIYVMKCADKYKIGFSKNISERLKQLNNRPFPVKLCYESKEIIGVYGVEQDIHFQLSEYKIDGEWYDFKNISMTSVISIIETAIENNDFRLKEENEK